LGACRQHRVQDLPADEVARPQIGGGGDPAGGFLAADPHPGGQYIGPGLPADLMRGGPVGQCGLDAVIDGLIGAGPLFTFGLQGQQFGGIEHREIGVQQCLHRRGTVGHGMAHRVPTRHRLTVHG
jgi:hypothetical protein